MAAVVCAVQRRWTWLVCWCKLKWQCLVCAVRGGGRLGWCGVKKEMSMCGPPKTQTTFCPRNCDGLLSVPIHIPCPAYIPRCSRWSSCCCQRLSVAHQPQPLLSTPLLFLWAQLRPSHSPVTPVVHNQHRHPVHFSSCTPQTHVVSCVKSGPNDWTTSISPH
jgi:hypothetical protein